MAIVKFVQYKPKWSSVDSMATMGFTLADMQPEQATFRHVDNRGIMLVTFYYSVLNELGTVRMEIILAGRKVFNGVVKEKYQVALLSNLVR